MHTHAESENSRRQEENEDGKRRISTEKKKKTTQHINTFGLNVCRPWKKSSAKSCYRLVTNIVYIFGLIPRSLCGFNEATTTAAAEATTILNSKICYNKYTSKKNNKRRRTHTHTHTTNETRRKQRNKIKLKTSNSNSYNNNNRPKR